jgi:hypothetical protein
MTTNPVHAVPPAAQLQQPPNAAHNKPAPKTQATQAQDSVTISAAARSQQSSAAAPAAAETSESARADKTASSSDADHDGH